jgi:hypothetical protein
MLTDSRLHGWRSSNRFLNTHETIMEEVQSDLFVKIFAGFLALWMYLKF